MKVGQLSCKQSKHLENPSFTVLVTTQESQSLTSFSWILHVFVLNWKHSRIHVLDTRGTKIRSYNHLCLVKPKRPTTTWFPKKLWSQCYLTESYLVHTEWTDAKTEICITGYSKLTTSCVNHYIFTLTLILTLSS